MCTACCTVLIEQPNGTKVKQRKSMSALGAYFRLLCARMDKPKAVTAAAHKLARLIHSMLTKGEEDTDQGQASRGALSAARAAQPESAGAAAGHDPGAHRASGDGGLKNPLRIIHSG